MGNLRRYDLPDAYTLGGRKSGRLLFDLQSDTDKNPSCPLYNLRLSR